MPQQQSGGGYGGLASGILPMSLAEQQAQMYAPLGTALPAMIRAQREQGFLQNLLESGGKDLKSPIGLAGNLLATALMSRRADADMQSLYQMGQQGFQNTQVRMLKELGYNPDGTPADA